MHKIDEIVLQENNFSSFNEMQKKVLEKGVFEKNLVISSPTASGKTIVLELAALNCILNKKKKVVYTCPLRALASEHYNDFKRKYAKKFGIRAALSIGDFDSSSTYLKDYDIIFSTNEKVDSLLRHKAEWLSSVGLLVIDEIHELDSDRGPTLEMVVTKMRFVIPNIQLVALSATIPNSKELSEWLGADLVQSNFRPVKLTEGVYFNGSFEFGKGKEEIPLQKEGLPSVCFHTLQKQKQALVFLNTRKNAEGLAKKLSALTTKTISLKEKETLVKASQKILNTLEYPTEQCKTISGLVENGVAFHHAGLLQKQREVIEENFRQGVIKIICSTTTLGAGINLPAYRVLIPSIYRYTEIGNQPITVREYKQLAGRAGRPAFHEDGQSVLFARSELELDELMVNYVNGELESVSSKLGIEPILRTHLLALISSNFVFDLQSIEDFFSKTFYFKQFGSNKEFFQKITKLLSELKDMGFVESNDKRFYSTLLGRRVSELYLDPLSAFKMITSLKKNVQQEMAYLYILSNTSEMSPHFSVPRKAEGLLWGELEDYKTVLPIEVEKEMYFDTHLLKKFNTSLIFKEWVNETPEEKISKDFGVQPGIMHSKKQIAEWLAYSCFELSKILGLTFHLNPLDKLQKRIHHGVKEELVNLVELRGIGRVRARKMYNAGLRTILDIKKIDVVDLQKIIPPAVALKVKAQLKS